MSPWHEVPLFAEDGNLHYINEIPKETSAKMEVATVGVLQQCLAVSEIADPMWLPLVQEETWVTHISCHS